MLLSKRADCKNAFEEWSETVKFRVKQSTLANYLGKAEIHILPAFGDVQADELDVSCVQQFIAKKLSSGLSPNYVADIRNFIELLFVHLHCAVLP